MYAFPLDSFLGRFPEFANEEVYPIAKVQNCGDRAMLHITPSQIGMPMHGFYREYALFLMTAHLLTLDAADDADGGEPGGSMAGTPFKATVGSVTVETTKQNSFRTDDWNYWLNQTKYGRELLAYLDVQTAPGIFINPPCESVRDLI